VGVATAVIMWLPLISNNKPVLDFCFFPLTSVMAALNLSVITVISILLLLGYYHRRRRRRRRRHHRCCCFVVVVVVVDVL